MDTNDLKVKALEIASALHCSPVANNQHQGASARPSDVVDTAAKLFAWLNS